MFGGGVVGTSALLGLPEMRLSGLPGTIADNLACYAKLKGTTFLRLVYRQNREFGQRNTIDLLECVVCPSIRLLL